MSAVWDGIGWLTTARNWWGPAGLLRGFQRHLWMSAISTVLAVAVGVPIGVWIGHTGKGRFAAAGGATALRAVPTIGIVTLLYIERPTELWPVLLALFALAVPPVMLATAAGIDSIEPEVRIAALAQGMTARQVVWQVELPCALPLLLGGVRSAANQVIATATIAGFGFGLGGLGTFIYVGFGTQHMEQMWGGTLAVIGLVLAVEVVLVLVQRRVVSAGLRRPRSGTRRGRLAGVGVTPAVYDAIRPMSRLEGP